MQRYVIPSLVISTWLFLWAADIGVLVLPTRDYYGLQCNYLIGFGIEKRSDRYAPRCRLLSRFG